MEGDYAQSQSDPGAGAKRRRHEENEGDIDSRLSSLVVRVGDKGVSSMEAQLEGLATALEADLAMRQEQIVETIFLCTTDLSHKTAVYGTLVGLINAKKFEFGKAMVERVHTGLGDALATGNHTRVKSLVRFVAELANANAVTLGSVTELLTTFASCTAQEEEEEGEVPEGYTDFFAFLVLSTLPCIGRELAQHKPNELAHVLSSIDGYLARRRREANAAISAFEVAGGSPPDFLDDLWQRVTAMRRDDWQCQSLLHPHKSLEDRIGQSIPHVFPPIRVPARETDAPPSPLRSVFRLFDRADTEKDMSPIDRFLVMDTIIDILLNFNFNRREAVRQILGIQVPFRIDHLLVETTLSQMFLLPMSPFVMPYYGVLLIDLCKMVQTIPPVLAMAIELLFEKLELMDVEVMDRFAEWFAYHIGNFDWKWNWDMWAEVVGMPPESRKHIFLRDILNRCTRLSYWERIKRTLPEKFHEFLPPLPETNFSFSCDTEGEGVDEAGQLLAKIQGKDRESAEAILTWLEGLKLGADLKLQILMECLLLFGSKSISHLLNAVERYHHVLVSLGNTHGAKEAMIRVVIVFWQNSEQHQILILDKLMTFRVIDSISIINWLFSPGVTQQFRCPYFFQILHGTVNKTLAKAKTIRKDLNDAEEKRTKGEAGGEPERIQKIHAALEVAKREQKELFLVVFQRFTTLLTEHINARGGTRDDVDDTWLRTVLNRMLEMGRRYYVEVKPFLSTLDTLLFSGDEDERIVAVFRSIRAVCESY